MQEELTEYEKQKAQKKRELVRNERTQETNSDSMQWHTAYAISAVCYTLFRI